MPDLFVKDVCNCGHPEIEGTPCHKVCRHCKHPIRNTRRGVHDARCVELHGVRCQACERFQIKFAETLLAALARSSPF